MNSTIVQEKKRGRTAVVSGLTPYTGTFGKEQLTHLLKRTMFGAKKADIDYFTGKTLDDVVSALLVAPPLPTALPLRTYADSTTVGVPADTAVLMGQPWVNAKEDGYYNGGRSASLRAWWAGQILNQTRSIHEKMVLFWANHFSTEMDQTSALLVHQYQMTIRKNALGNFKNLARDITFEPNMLRYLNGYVNNKTAPDENYGRELQELFTVGKGPNSKYTEDDVKAAAKVLTGWSIRQVETATGSGMWNYESYFIASRHETADKAFSSFYSKTIAGSTTAGNTEANARREIDDLINMILATNEAALYVCRRLYRFFVYYDIDATVESEVIAPMAQIFRANYDIVPVLKALFSSDHFFDIAQKACVIKSPLDYVIGAMREFNVEFPLPADYIYQYSAWSMMVESRINGAVSQGQYLADPPNVAGWPAYYQEPVYHEVWINTDTFPKRLKFIDQFFTTNGVTLATGKKLWVDTPKFTLQFGDDASDPNKLVDAALALLYRVPPTAAMKAYLKTTILLDGQASDHYWSDAWEAYKLAPTNATNLSIVTTRLQKFYKFIVENPEFQLS